MTAYEQKLSRLIANVNTARNGGRQTVADAQAALEAFTKLELIKELMG